MGYKVEWYIPDRIIQIQFGKEITLDELGEMNNLVKGMHDSVADSPHKIHVIVDLGELRTAPIYPQQIRNKLVAVRPPNTGTIVVYNAKPIIALILRAVMPLVQPHVYYTETLEAALAFLLRADPSLQATLPQSAQHTV